MRNILPTHVIPTLLVALALASVPSVFAEPGLDSALQRQVADLVGAGDAAGLGALAERNPADAAAIARNALAATQDALAVTAKFAFFDSPEARAAAKAAGAIEPKSAADIALAAVRVGADSAGAAPTDALSIAQSALQIATTRQVRTAAASTVETIARFARDILAQRQVRGLLDEAQYQQLLGQLLSLLPPPGSKSQVELMTPTAIDPSVRSVSGG